MGGGTSSREHHWWPLALQTFWKDKEGDVWWIDPDGKIDHKRVKNRKVGKKANGHTLLKGSAWETNFEERFASADNSVRTVVKKISDLKPMGSTISENAALFKLVFKRGRVLRDVCKFYDLNSATHRSLTLLMMSLFIRSPRNRDKYTTAPVQFNLPQDDDVGKINMLQKFHLAESLCKNGPISNQYFVVIHSPFRKFICGDGHFDHVTGDLNRIHGRAFLVLTPHLCVYFCTPNAMMSSPNCAALIAPPWMVDHINSNVQIYSRDMLFFHGKPPELSAAFRQRAFLEKKYGNDELTEMLDEIGSIRKPGSIFSANLLR